MRTACASIWLCLASLWKTELVGNAQARARDTKAQRSPFSRNARQRKGEILRKQRNITKSKLISPLAFLKIPPSSAAELRSKRAIRPPHPHTFTHKSAFSLPKK